MASRSALRRRWAFRLDATKVTPETILFLEVKEGADKTLIRQALESYLAEGRSVNANYQPEQAYKLENARVLEKGSILSLVVSPDAGKTNAALGNGWR